MSGIEVIAVPSMFPGGLDAQRSGHFGHCDLFTLVVLKNKEVQSTQQVANAEHGEGGCLIPVKNLYRAGATSLVVAGIGRRPRLGFEDAGIKVLVGQGETVGEVIEAYKAGQVRPIENADLCGGHGHQ